MMTLSTLSTWRLSPERTARPTPTIVVSALTFSLIRRAWFAADAARAVSSGPDGLVARPHTAGSYAARYASSEYPSVA
jgi:hypothetical protein